MKDYKKIFLKLHMCQTKKISCFSILGIILLIGVLLFIVVYTLRTNDEIRGQIKVNKEDIIDKNRSPSTIHTFIYNILYWISFTSNPTKIDNFIIETNITQISSAYKNYRYVVEHLYVVWFFIFMLLYLRN